MEPRRSIIVEVQPMQTLNGPTIYGNVIPLVLSCGHTKYGNASMMHRIGDTVQCFKH